MALTLSWTATSRRPWGGYDDAAHLRRNDDDRADLGEIVVNDEVVRLTVAELRELATAAAAIADQIEATRG